MKTLLSALLFYAACVGACAQSVHSENTPAALLERARAVMGFAQVGDRVLHYRAGAALEENYQSDRNYPPFFSAMSRQEIWFQPKTGVLRVEADQGCVFEAGAHHHLSAEGLRVAAGGAHRKSIIRAKKGTA